MDSLKGKKTYILAILVGVATVANHLGYLDDSMFQSILALLGAGTAASLAAKGNRINKNIDTKLLIFFCLMLVPSFAYAQVNPSLKADSTYRNKANDGTDLGAHSPWKEIETCAVKGATSPECLGFRPNPTPNPIPTPDPDPVTLLPGTMFAGKPFDLYIQHNGIGVGWYTAKVNGVYASHVGMGSWKDGVLRIAMNALPVGTHKITVEARKDAGLVSSTTVEVTFVAPPLMFNVPVIQLNAR